MRRLAVRNVTRGFTLGDQILLADGWWARLRGLLGRPAPAAGEGLLLVPCRSIHMLGMRYPIDVAFLDRNRDVRSLHHAVRPGLHTAGNRGAWCALELPAGTLAASGTEAGDRLDWSPAGDANGASRGSHLEAVP